MFMLNYTIPSDSFDKITIPDIHVAGKYSLQLFYNNKKNNQQFDFRNISLDK